MPWTHEHIVFNELCAALSPAPASSMITSVYINQLVYVMFVALFLPWKTLAQTFTPHPTRSPALTSYPTASPSPATASILKYDLSFRVNNYNEVARKLLASSGLRAQHLELTDAVTLDGAEQQVLVDAVALAQGIDSKYVTFSRAQTSPVAATIIHVFLTTSIPLSGEFAGMSSGDVFDALTFDFINALYDNSFTTNVKALAVASGVTALTSIFISTNSLSTIGNPSTAVYTEFNEDDSLTISDGEITAIVILTNVGLAIVVMGGFFLYKLYLQYNLRKNLLLEQNSDAPKVEDDEKKPAEVVESRGDFES
jgi:hypothetical protein